MKRLKDLSQKVIKLDNPRVYDEFNGIILELKDLMEQRSTVIKRIDQLESYLRDK